jgi:hypothetical protein
LKPISLLVKNMAWGWWGKGRCARGPWPGNGPFSYLPPWERPGWIYGPGACWWIYGARVPPPPPGISYYTYPGLTASDLEAYKKWLEDARARLDEQIRELDKRIREIKEKQ